MHNLIVLLLQWLAKRASKVSTAKFKVWFDSVKGIFNPSAVSAVNSMSSSTALVPLSTANKVFSKSGISRVKDLLTNNKTLSVLVAAESGLLIQEFLDDHPDIDMSEFMDALRSAGVDDLTINSILNERIKHHSNISIPIVSESARYTAEEVIAAKENLRQLCGFLHCTNVEAVRFLHILDWCQPKREVFEDVLRMDNAW